MRFFFLTLVGGRRGRGRGRGRSGRCYRSACLVAIVLACVFTLPLRVMAKAL